MRRANRGMVILTALIMTTMLGLMTASALRTAAVATLDVAWVQDEWRTRLALDHVLKNTIAATLADLTPVAPTTVHRDGVQITWKRETIGAYNSSPFWDGGTCAEIRLEGRRRAFLLTQVTVVCLPTDASESRIVAWREMTL
ncbi:MAG: hypothetical protein AAF265_09365 [Pseudomonadota bacterium]